ncbi:hypothetical protein DFJ43DRAFT_1194373 [Lentinula guzmanii]|uniref:Uncharacterized protein n=1 Tax=Lentinula guzmanii TaxID=2804957 RepID=A0AA38JET1_9AGAR|nr:hypothetical protein DFJ43DRAFT_1194373 [Lentinula guzmanii]
MRFAIGAIGETSYTKASGPEFRHFFLCFKQPPLNLHRLKVFSSPLLNSLSFQIVKIRSRSSLLSFLWQTPMNTITSELPPRPIVDTQNPLYCPAESASPYLQSIKTGGGIQKLNKKGKLTNLLGKKGKKITVSSFSKMLAQAAVAMRKEKENHSGRKESALSLSQISSNDSTHDYGTPERRPIRKTRKDRAAQSPVKEKLLTSSPQHNISPTFYSICVSLPKIPIDDLLSESPTSTISLPFTDASADSCITDSISPSVPLAPPGLNLQTKHEPPHESDIGQQQPKSSACVQQTKNETFIPEKKKKRSLEEAFPELLKKPSMFKRSIPASGKNKLLQLSPPNV